MKPRLWLRLSFRLGAVIVLVTAVLVGAVTAYLSTVQAEWLADSLEHKTLLDARLAAKHLEPAVAFGDRQTAREVFEAMAQDDELMGVAVLNARGGVIEGRGAVEIPATVSDEATLVRRADRITATAPIRTLEGPRGTVVLDMSTAALAASRAALWKRAVTAALVALVLGAVFAGVLARSLSVRLQSITRAASAVTNGAFSTCEPVRDHGPHDELRLASDGFDAMIAELRKLFALMRSSAESEQRRLEEEVAARTSDIRRLLDSSGQGFATLDQAGLISAERSSALERWLGPPPASQSFADWMAPHAPERAEWFRFGWEEVWADVLPPAVALAQLPAELSFGDRVLSLTFTPLSGPDGKLERVFLVVTDVTAERQHRAAEDDEREATRLLSALLEDRAGLLAFVQETDACVDALVDEGLDELTRARKLHTLKGTSAVLGLGPLSHLCHEAESRIAEGTRSFREAVEPVRERWLHLAAKIRHATGRGDELDVRRGDLELVARAASDGADGATVARMIAEIGRPRLEAVLGRAAAQTRATAAKLEKVVDVVVEVDGAARLPEGDFQPLLSAWVHVLRNAVDHGVESADERAAAGKPAVARVTLRAVTTPTHFRLEVLDDGRGIDWGEVSVHATERGLPHATAADLERALFDDGFSTAVEASETSGRGVGLGAVLAACRSLGGAARVESRSGAGTRFYVEVPLGGPASGQRLGEVAA